MNIYYNNSQLVVNKIDDMSSNDVYVQGRKYLEGIGFTINWNEEERKVEKMR